MTVTDKQIAALNAAGEALKALDLGAVRLRWRPADGMIPCDGYALSVDAGDEYGALVGLGATPEAALADALAQKEAG